MSTLAEPEDDDEPLLPTMREVMLSAVGGRLDKALADAAPELSRSRLQALMAEWEEVSQALEANR